MKATPTVNSLFSTAAAVQMWLDQIAEQTGSFFPENMQHIILGGDEVSPSFLQRVFDNVAGSPKIEVRHIYGSTEGTVFSSYSVLTRPIMKDMAQRRRTPIDSHLSYSSMTVVSPTGNELPRGFVGEIIIWVKYTGLYSLQLR
jgi:acyl-CoA synthetase (AMP-forming)/AMP-acid ligase II